MLFTSNRSLLCYYPVSGPGILCRDGVQKVFPARALGDRITLVIDGERGHGKGWKKVRVLKAIGKDPNPRMRFWRKGHRDQVPLSESLVGNVHCALRIPYHNGKRYPFTVFVNIKNTI